MSQYSGVLGANLSAATSIGPSRDVVRSTAWKLLACSWLLMLMTFSPPRGGSLRTADSFDAVAIAKLGARAIVLVVLTWACLRLWTTPRRKVVMQLMWPWLAFTAWIILSVAWSPLRTISLGQAASFTVLVLLALNMAMYVQRTETELVLKQVTSGLTVACFLLLGLCVALPDWGCLTRGGRGLMHATNGSATASIGCTLLIASRWLYGWKWSRRLFWPGLAIFGATLVLAQNRTAIALTFVIVMGLAACVAPFWRSVVMALSGIGGAIYLALDQFVGTTDAILEQIAVYMARGQSVSQLSKLSGREEMWTAMWNSYLESPWLGHGWFVTSAKGEIYVWYAWVNWTAHNFWLQVLVTTGAIGTALMAWAMGTSILRVLGTFAPGNGDRKFGILISAVFLWQIGWGINNESFVGPVQPESVVFFVMLSLLVSRAADSVLAKRAAASNRIANSETV